jgi:hypothetical protein
MTLNAARVVDSSRRPPRRRRLGGTADDSSDTARNGPLMGNANTSGSASGGAEGISNNTDVTFARDMVPHHQQSAGPNDRMGGMDGGMIVRAGHALADERHRRRVRPTVARADDRPPRGAVEIAEIEM